MRCRPTLLPRRDTRLLLHALLPVALLPDAAAAAVALLSALLVVAVVPGHHAGNATAHAVACASGERSMDSQVLKQKCC
jgi:hypothetical protein